MGVEVNVRVVDSSQYINRVRSRDYDIIVHSWRQSLSPGNEQREYWSSAAADREGSRNMIGIKNPVVDDLIDKVIFAKDRQELVTATRALDRVLLHMHLVVPQWSSPVIRMARWDRFGHPSPLPAYSIGFPDIWWYDAAKAQAIEAQRKP
jgi:microcin C transport system substrate-binding protein